MEHNITTELERRMDGLDWYRAVCSCGKYRSTLHGLPGRAERAGKNHAASKTRNEQAK